MKRAFLTALFGLSAAMTTATLSHAAEPDAAMQSFFETHIQPWSGDAVLTGAIAAQNARTGGFGASEIATLDETWRAEVGTGSSELVDSVLMNAAADFLRAQVEASGGMLTEVFIMDSHGLNVAASAPTSDYWQGDEAKFQKTYDVGPTAVHFSEIEFDESSQTYQAQISMTLTDPATGEAIGAMTVGIDAEAFM